MARLTIWEDKGDRPDGLPDLKVQEGMEGRL